MIQASSMKTSITPLGYFDQEMVDLHPNYCHGMMRNMRSLGMGFWATLISDRRKQDNVQISYNLLETNGSNHALSDFTYRWTCSSHFVSREENRGDNFDFRDSPPHGSHLKIGRNRWRNRWLLVASPAQKTLGSRTDILSLMVSIFSPHGDQDDPRSPISQLASSMPMYMTIVYIYGGFPKWGVPPKS